MMIKSINSGSKYIAVSGGNPSIPYISGGQLSAGQMRYNPNMQGIEVYDGSIWHMMSNNYASVDLTSDATAILDWAKRKMLEEQRIDELCKKYPGLEKARVNFELFKKFVEVEEQQKLINN
jgi:hypothetical protein